MKLSYLKILNELSSGKAVAASKFNSELLDELNGEQLIMSVTHGSRISYEAVSVQKLTDYYYIHHNIKSFDEAIKLYDEVSERSGQVLTVGDSKFVKKRTFTGFLVNCYEPINAAINDEPFTVFPKEGTFTFIYDYQYFTIPNDVIVVGIENPENFRNISRQKHLFRGLKCLFTSRYPQNQNKDFIEWLRKIPNKYLHFGDFDFSGLNIFLSEYKKYLCERAKFFVPENLEDYFSKYGNRDLFNRQTPLPKNGVFDDEVKFVISLIYKYSKGFEQEGLIKSAFFSE
ncbi:MAG: hypothetical protein II937_06490 [Bacteroidales bacterium]|nr:hypothetical protein [Bacteroidales bacterium]